VYWFGLQGIMNDKRDEKMVKKGQSQKKAK
jgi:hypothetical protein